MSCKTHDSHSHEHGTGCGHQAVQHDDHVCYVHDGHLHYVHGNHVDEHSLSGHSGCTPEHKCSGHEAGHQHGANCGHEALPHDGHTDYLVGGHLHHPHAQHCDDHGAVKTK